MTATVEPAGAGGTITWKSSDTKVAIINEAGIVTGVSPGITKITATVGGKESAAVEVTISGLVLSKTSLTLLSGKGDTLSYQQFGDAEAGVAAWTSDKRDVATVNSGQIRTGNPGSAVITLSKGGYTATCTVTVSENTAGVIKGSMGSSFVMKFDTIRTELDKECRDVLGNGLSYIANLSVPTDQGILYYGYVSADETGPGIASSITERYYYTSASDGRRVIEKVTFVPKPSFSGTAAISYTGFDSSNNFFTGEIRVEVAESSDVRYSIAKGTPLVFEGTDFNAICRNREGRDLNYITFTTPSSSTGTLYYNYESDGTYGAHVTDRDPYYYKKTPNLDSITFVPAANFTGTARISYTAVDSAGNRYGGRVSIQVSDVGGQGSVGDISYKTYPGGTATFASSDFNSMCRNVTGSNLDYVRFDLPDRDEGILYYNYRSSSNYGSRVTSSTLYYRSGTPSLSRVSFVAASGYRGTLAINFTAWDVDGTRLTGTVSIKVSGGGEGDVSYSSNTGRPVTFSASDFNAVSRSVTGRTLDYVRFTLPSSSDGTLYYNYSSSNNSGTAVSASTNYYRNSSPSLNNVTFVPKSGTSGTVEFSFTGWDTEGERFTGTVEILVRRNSSSGIVSYSTNEGEAVRFSASDFDDACRSVTDSALQYVRFELPSSTEGRLSYNSADGSRVSANTNYYRTSNPSLSNVYFQPRGGTVGRVNIDFTGYSNSGDRFEGTVQINIRAGEADIEYTTSEQEAVVFSAADFNSLCQSVQGYNLDYVRFTLPSSSDGTLYYNYSETSNGARVSSSTNCGRTGNQTLDRVAFVPARDFTGTCRIKFTGYDVNRNTFSGVVSIEVERGQGGGDSTLHYELIQGGVLTLKSGDLNDACRSATGYDLNYLRFDLPNTDQGALFYQYDQTDGTFQSRVSESTSYYRTNGSRLVSNVTFVANRNFTGTAQIEYTGHNSRGRQFHGVIEISITQPVLEPIRYTAGTAVLPFQSGDFADTCRSLTGRELDYIQFTAPEASLGTLYYQYTGPSRYDSKVDSNTRYYVSGSPSLSGVSFLPAAGANGTAVVPFTGQDASGTQFSGQVEITISAPTTSSVFTDMTTYGWAAASVDFLYTNNIATGTTATLYSPAQAMTRGDFTLMLCRTFQLNTGNTNSFSDVPSNSHYAWAIGTAKDLGIIEGTNGRFFPGESITRQDAAVMLQRAMKAAGLTLNDGNGAVLQRFTDANQVSPYAAGALSALVERGVFQGNNRGALNPTGTMSRAEMAVLLHRALTK